MKELFSPSNLTWLVPLLVVCALMILLAAYALRDDIAAICGNFFMPKEKRYTLSQPIIAPPAQNRRQTQPAVQSVKPDERKILAPQAAPAPRPPDLYQPSPFTIIDKAQFTSNLQAYKAPKDSLHVMAAMSRWYWRKIKRKFKTRQRHIAAETPAAASARAMAHTANLETAPVKSGPLPQSQAQPAPITPDIAPQRPQQPTAPAEVPPRHPAKINALTGERVFFASVLLVLMAFIIFLVRQIGRLSAAVEVQNSRISALQNRGAQVKDFVSYEPPPEALK
ncbi:MAG: hypothetical protein LBG16_02055 [Elusimicrobiota bacterium]|jgi:hypothetical protein|nr:hypothetical protein [Elusimicrobiota bacterium]